MKYRYKVIILFIVTSIITNGLLAIIMFGQSRTYLFKEIQSKVLSIAATISSLIDGDLHNELKSRSDEAGDAYKSLESDIRKARDANRRDDVNVSYVYTMMTAEENPDIFLFAVDAEESLEKKSHIGDVYIGEYEGEFKLDELQVDESVNRDQWGEWISANAPLLNSSGKVVAAVGVDISAKDVLKKINRLFFSALTALGASIFIAIAVSLFLSKHVTKPLYLLKNSLDKIRQGDLHVTVDMKRGDEFGEVAESINAMVSGLREREALKSTFARYVSKQVRDKVLITGDIPDIKGERRKVTVLFSDIRGFTEVADSMQPEDVVGLLNEYFEKMIEVTFKYHGTLDKFIGDGMMVIFGAPLDDPYQEENALKAALDMRVELNKLCEKWSAQGRSELKIGIGINTGNAIVGNIGSTQHMEYTAIGDAVNLASRLESATKEYDTDILISEYTYVETRTLFNCTRIGDIRVKGRADSVTVYSVQGVKEKSQRF